jgi:glycolate oxidase FAD binding subunit
MVVRMDRGCDIGAAELHAASGSAREAGPGDTVGGVAARFVAAPVDAAHLAELLRICTRGGLSVVARGDATKLDWAAAPSAMDVIVDTSFLAGVYEHAAGDLVVTLGAGTPLRAAQAVLSRAGQRLAMDPPSREATIGGIIATGEAGPLRHTFGAPRDLLIGVEFARADGELVRSGGKVVKNVAGYDLGKLLAGSYGTLGIITQATFRAHPLPAASAFVAHPVRSPAHLTTLVASMLTSSLAPTAIEVDLPGEAAPDPPAGIGSLVVLFEGSTGGVPERCRAAASLLGPDSLVTPEPPPWWGSYPFEPDRVALRLSVPIAEMHAVVYALRDAMGAPVPVRGSAGIGLAYAALPGDLPVAKIANVLDAVRTTMIARGGTCVVLYAPAALRNELDLWGPVSGFELMRRIKHEFDPTGTLAPGRFVGGL